MKKVIVMLAVLAIAAPAMAVITGSAHDFTTGGGLITTTEICITCHTPHNADLTVGDAPLWNHQVTVAAFNLYSSTTLDASLEQPGGVSKLCLSCHDGTVALDSFAGATGTISIPAEDAHYVGTDLSGEHPISFAYDATLFAADDGLFDPAVGLSGLGGTIAADLLINDQLECSSCHDVHNAVTANASLLVIDNAASALCLTCHNK